MDASNPKDTEKSDRPTAQFYDIIAILLMAAGAVVLFSKPSHDSIAFLFLFIGFAFHYVVGLRIGVLSSRFFFFRWSLTVYRDDSPTAFFLATIVEGLWVLGLFLLFL